MSERKANPNIAPLITNPGDSKKYTGTRDISSFLPEIFRTDINKGFIDTTLDQLLSTGSLQPVKSYVGSKFNKNTTVDNYIADNRDSDPYQFTPSLVNVDKSNNISQVMPYDDLINQLKFNEVNMNNHNKVFDEKGYTLDLPINYDMFINYHKYYWALDTVPHVSIKPTSSAIIDIDKIVNSVTYTTPTLSTSNTLTLQNGMRIMFDSTVLDKFTQSGNTNKVFTSSVAITTGTVKVYKNTILQTVNVDYTYNSSSGVVTFTNAPANGDTVKIRNFYAHSTSGDYAVGDIYIVDNVGDSGGIKLTKHFASPDSYFLDGDRVWLNHTMYSSQEPVGFDEVGIGFDLDPYDFKEYVMTTRDYVVEQRYSKDQSAWARSNLWVHEDTIKAITEFDTSLNFTDYVLDKIRAVRPIIEYKGNFQKYNFGQNHIDYVNFVYGGSNFNPATGIVGKTEFTWNVQGSTAWASAYAGYTKGAYVYVDVGSSPNILRRYYECVQSHTEPKNPIHGENNEYWSHITPREIENGDKFLFVDTANSAYDNKIYKVSGVGTSIALTEIFGPSSTAINTNDKIVILNGRETFNTDPTASSDLLTVNKPYSGSEIYWNGTAWVYGQQKLAKSTAMNVTLFDINGVSLNDTSLYPQSESQGLALFDYSKNLANTVDDALGFAPDYVDYGNSPGLNFEMPFLTNEIYYTDSNTNNQKSRQKIKGYYLFKDFNNKTFNGWSLVRNGQPVKRLIRKTVTKQTATQALNFDLGYGTYNNDRCYTFTKFNGLYNVKSQQTTSLKNNLNDINGTMPELFWNTNTTYTIKTQFPQAEIEFVNTDGTAIAGGYTRNAGSGDEFTIAITNPTVSEIKYRIKASPTNYGIIYFNTVANDTTVKVYNNGSEVTNYTISGNILTITGGLSENDKYEVEYYTHNVYSDTAEGDQQVADVQTLNPQNTTMTKVSFGDLIEHMRNQMESIPGFTGNYFGVNNYRNLAHVHEFGGTIRQQPYSTEMLNQTMMDKDTDIISSVKHASNNYSLFLQKFKQKAVQLNKSLDISKSVHELTDETLKALSLGSNKDSAFARSDMAMFKEFTSEDFSFTNTATKVFDLPQSVNTYQDSQNHIQVWVNDADGLGNKRWRSLVKGIDYTLASNKVTITTTITYPSDGLARAHVRWYKRDSLSFVPSSAVKLGMIKPHNPELRSDYSIDSNSTANTNVIIAHDGSVHIRKGTELYDRSRAGFSPEDAVIYDLECRIFNNLNIKHDDVKNISTYGPNAHRADRYSWAEVQDSIKSEYNKWSIKNNKSGYNATSYYSGGDKFTWNYSSVTPNIGGWRGIYHYFFNTDKPHTHPWKMMGYSKKPTWWDSNYSWTNATKRSALITALKYGKVSDPSTNDVFDINYSYNSYDWANNVLVTNAGVLNDPDTANVVGTPSAAERSKDFAYGDWGPVEAEWRSTSEYKIVSFLALLKTRPLIALNDYFSTNYRVEKNVNNATTKFDKPIIVSNKDNKLTSFKTVNLSREQSQGKIVELVRIVSAGTGYTSAPTITINDNFGSDATMSAFIENGSVKSVSITNTGSNYYNSPTVTVSGNAVIDAYIADNHIEYHVGLQNAMIEYARIEATSSADIRVRLDKMKYSPIIKAGGFVNNNQKFILESSQDKGRVVVPEENYKTILYNSKPSREYFYGGIILEKVSSGYKISGYDNSNYYFNYNKSDSNSSVIAVPIDNITVNRYTGFETSISQLNYNTTITTIQDTYNFILGYGNYLNGLGFPQDWKSLGVDFITWANGDSADKLYLIPNANSIIVNDGHSGYFDNLDSKYDGVFNINDSLGKRISSNDLIVNRNLMIPDSDTVFKTKTSATEVYGLRLYKTEIEHIIVFDSITDFSDVLYDPIIGQRHTRIVWQGSRTKDWNGKLYSPGFIVNNDTIIPNFDSLAGQADEYFGKTKTLSDKQKSNVARFNVGYNQPTWAENLDIEDDSLFELVKGSYKYKGTRHALDSFLRNKGIFDADATGELHEEWAVRLGDFGDTRSRETLEFEITPDLVVTSPQPVRFFDTQKYDVLTDLSIDIDLNSPLIVTGTPGSNFTTRAVNTYDNNSITEENVFANDYIKAGLPLTSETDFRVLKREDMLSFPTPTKSVYSFDGDWQLSNYWEPDKSYKFNDKIIYQGKAYQMIDPKGYSGLSSANESIELIGAVALPVVPASGGTIVIDNNTVSLTKTSTTTALGVINKIGTQDIVTSNVVTHGSTLIFGENSVLAETITFANTVSTTNYSNIVKTGTVSNPSFVGSATKTLIIDGTTVTFNDTVSSTSNVTLQAAFENAFNANGFSNVTTLATNRSAALESLRVAYISANNSSAWATFLTTYFSVSDAGVNMTQTLALYNTSPSYATQLASLITSDVALINAKTGNSYVASAVLSGSTVIPSSDITSTQTAIASGAYITAVKTYLIANPTVTITNSTVVTTQSSTVFKTYSLSDIVNKITAAGIANITASASSNFLRITKTTSTPTVAYSLVISAGTANSDVGFSSVTETIAATSSITTSTPNLTISQVVSQINNANITGITAQINSANTNLLQINCNLANLFIGTGTANSVIGLTQGVTPASTSTSTSGVALGINDIVDKINTATISGVTASNSNNRLKLTSTNSTLVIGAGTANSVIGITAKTITAIATNVSNVFNAIVSGVEVFQEITDPNVLSIWVADDSEFGNYNKGYEVYQTMDFDMYISKSCAGVDSADEAQITVSRNPSNLTQAHNLVAGDFVLIRGSATTPSIDGIHKVTRVDTSNTAQFYIDEYIQEEGAAGNVYPLRPVRFDTYNSLDSVKNQQVNGVYKYNFSGTRQQQSANPIYAFVDDDGYNKSAVYKWVGDWDDNNGHNNGSWNLVRNGIEQARNDLISNVKIYDAVSRTSIANIETYDPAKGIIFGFIDKEIDFKLVNDIASYNYNTNDGEIINTSAWKDEWVGTRWWNISTAIYLDYEQSTIDYQQANWGKLADGATIDIYEWTRSPVLPDQWSQAVDDAIVIDGSEASGEAYFNIINNEKVYNWTEQVYYNPRTQRDESVYYFWVKDKLSYKGSRQYNVKQLSTLLTNPNGYGLSWAAASGDSQLLLNNIDSFVTKNSVVQVNQSYGDTNSMPLNEWKLLADGDPSCIIPEYFHIKMRDSLASYNNYAEDKPYTTWSSFTAYTQDAVVLHNGSYYTSLKPNQNNDPSTDLNNTNWSKIYDYSLIDVTQEDDIKIWKGQHLPDYDLHRHNRYGHLVRPRQTLFRNIQEARQNFIEALNDLVGEINVVDEINGYTVLFDDFVKGNTTYNLRNYTSYKDWYLVEKDASGKTTFSFNPNTVADVVYDNLDDYNNDVDPADGSYVLIKTNIGDDGINRQEMFLFTNEKSKLVYKEKATLEFSEQFWFESKFGHGFDSAGYAMTPYDSGSSEQISKLMDIVRSKIFIGRHKVKYNKLWFKLLYSAILQNTTDDFAFKTSYVKLKVKHQLLTNKEKYQRYSIETIEDYFNQIKPFHTKLLSLIDSNTHAEATDIQVDEQTRNMAITIKHNDHTTRDWDCDLVLDGGAFSTVFGNQVDYANFTTVDNDIEFIYNGNVFDQPACEGWGEELYPTDFTENIAISVQTNASGNTVTSDTRTFRMSVYQPNDIQFSNVIVDAQKTTTTASVTGLDTTIPVADATVLDNPNTVFGVGEVPGVVYINGERIEYSAVSGNNLLYCTRGTLGTAQKAHNSGATVVNSGATTRIPILEKFSDYGDNLRMAYNDSGVSLSAAGISPEHAFIRNAGQGSI